MFSKYGPGVGTHPGRGCEVGRILRVPMEAHPAKEFWKVLHISTSLQEYITALTNELALARRGKYFFTDSTL